MAVGPKHDFGVWPEIEQSEDPVYKRGIQMLMDGSPALLGMSLLNSYYGKKENLQSLFEYFGSKSAQIFILIPDKPSVHTYRARSMAKEKGQSNLRNSTPERSEEENVEKRVEKDVKSLKRKITEALEESDQGQKCKHIDWSEQTAKEVYKQSLEAILQLYENCPRFVEDVRRVTLPIVNNQEVAYEEAKNYLIKELAFFRVAHLLLDVPQLFLVYHREWPLLNSVLEGKDHNLLPVPELGFVIASPPTQALNATVNPDEDSSKTAS